MKRIDSQKVAIFLGVFGFLAATVWMAWEVLQEADRQHDQQSLTRSSVHQMSDSRNVIEQPAASLESDEVKRQRDETRRKEQLAEQAAKVAAQRAKFLARYLNPGFSRKEGMKAAAVLAVSERGKFNSALSAAIRHRFATNLVQMAPTLFTPEFVSDGMFRDAFANARNTFQALELTNSVDALLLAKQNVSYTHNPALENVITATMELEVALLPADSYLESQSWTFTSSGAGFTQAAARTMAEERLFNQLTNDTKMSFASILTSNPSP